MFLVSVIIPIYNVEKYLKQCINSILQQTYSNIEVIMVDDGSTDNSPQICDELAMLDSRIHLIHKENGGSSDARKTGVLQANGDYVMFVDGDDWIDVNTIEYCVDFVTHKPEIDCLLFSYMREYHEMQFVSHVFNYDITVSSETEENIVYRRLFGLNGSELRYPERLENVGSCCMKLYRRDIARKGKYFETKEVGSSEDTLFNIFALRDCYNIVYLDIPFYHYRKRDASITSSYRPQLVEQWIKLFNIIENVLKIERLDFSYWEAFNNRVALSVYGIGMNEVCGNNRRNAIINIKNYISQDWYKNAINKMNMKMLPLPWKILMKCAKYRISWIIYLELRVISEVKKRY